MAANNTPHPALSLLLQAHPTATASTIHDSTRHRPLLLRPSSPDPTSQSSKREARRQRRQQCAVKLRRQDRKAKKAGRNSLTPRAKPLSAKEKRALGVHDLTEAEKKWSIYVGLHELWCGYMREVLGIDPTGPATRQRALSADTAGPLLASADYHGAVLEVVRSGCVSRVGIRGIVVRDTKFTFVVITQKDEVKTVPKERTVFRIEVPLIGTSLDAETTGDEGVEASKSKPLAFEIYGEQFMTSAPDRANKKFKPHIIPSL